MAFQKKLLEILNYATTHQSEQSKHAASIASRFAETRKPEEAHDLLSHEWQLLRNARENAALPPASRLSSLMQSTTGFFSAAAQKAKNLYAIDHTPAHEKAYHAPVVDDGYEVMVKDSIAACALK